MCGTEDELYKGNLDFINYLDKNVQYDFIKSPGKHDYAFWDKAIEKVIKIFTNNIYNKTISLTILTSGLIILFLYRKI